VQRIRAKKGKRAKTSCMGGHAKGTDNLLSTSKTRASGPGEPFLRRFMGRGVILPDPSLDTPLFIGILAAPLRVQWQPFSSGGPRE
jgi:hypothetical protein